MGSSTEFSAYGPTHNPWSLDRIPGGSGGSSAAAVAAFEAPLALGSDTGGSIRQPGAVTGTVGVKPTYGSVSRYGAIALASSLDQVGPVSRTVLDSALLHDVIKGHDPRDSTSIDAPVPAVVTRTGWTALDIVALLVLLGALPIALLGAAIVVTGMGAATVWIAVATTLVAGTIGATGVHLAHRSSSRHDERIRTEVRASGGDSRR